MVVVLIVTGMEHKKHALLVCSFLPLLSPPFSFSSVSFRSLFSGLLIFPGEKPWVLDMLNWKYLWDTQVVMLIGSWIQESNLGKRGLEICGCDHWHIWYLKYWAWMDGWWRKHTVREKGAQERSWWASCSMAEWRWAHKATRAVKFRVWGETLVKHVFPPKKRGYFRKKRVVHRVDCCWEVKNEAWRCPLDLANQRFPDLDLGERCFYGMLGARVEE